MRRCILACLLIVLSSCDLPRDNAGTLERIRDTHEVHVGVTENPPWVVFVGEKVAGIEPALITEWATTLGARPKWQRGSEQSIVDALQRGELDVIAAGFTSATPFESQAALTAPFLSPDSCRHVGEERVLAARQGESALLLALDRFLLTRDALELCQRAHGEAS